MLSGYLKRSTSMTPKTLEESRDFDFFSVVAYTRNLIKTLMDSMVCTYFFCFIIVIYVAAMGFEIEMNANNKKYAVIVQDGCTIVFAIELLLRMYALGTKFFWGKDLSLNLLDLGLVVLSVVEMVIGGIDGNMKNTLNNILMLRIVRIIKAVRALRVVRLLRFCRSLRMLVHSILATLKSLAWALLLFIVIMYSFGIVFTQAAKEDDSASIQLDDYF